MSEEECKKLVRDAIAAGITHDMGSGSNIDLAVIKAGDKIDYLRFVISILLLQEFLDICR